MNRLFRSIAALAACVGLVATPALAQTTIPLTNLNAMPQPERFTQLDLVSAYTNATTSYTDVTGMTVTLPKTSGALTGNSQGSSALAATIRVCYFADVTKATATTGTIQIVSNAVALTASRRTVASSAGQTTMGQCYQFARPVTTSFIVKLQAVSGDTNVFTISNLQMTVEVQRIN